MVNDPIGDLLTRIRNAQTRTSEDVTVPSSKMLCSIVQILKDEGFVKDFKEKESKLLKNTKELDIQLKYSNKEGVIRNIKRVSKPGRRMYLGYREIPRILSGQGIVVLSTPKGIMTGEKAKKAKVGGEFLFKVW